MKKKKMFNKAFRIAKIIVQASPQKLVAMFVLNCAIGLLLPISLYASKQFIDSIASAITGNIDLWVCGVWLLSTVLIGPINIILTNWSQHIKESYSEKLALRLTSQIIDKCENFLASQFDNSNIYNQLNMAMKETPNRCSSLVDLAGGILRSFVAMGSLTVLLASFNWLLLVTLIIAMLPLIRLNNCISKKWYEIYTSQVENSRLMETLHKLLLSHSNIAELKLFDVYKRIKQDIISLMKKQHSARSKGRFTSLKLNFTSTGLSSLVVFFLKLWALVVLVSQRRSVGTITQLLGAIESLQASLRSLINETGTVYEQSLYIKTLFTILDLPEEPHMHLPDSDLIPQSIDFNHVSFAYPDSEKLVLEDINIHLEKGHIYGVVGVNGSGKSTLLKLLIGLYSPLQGCININGKDLQSISPKEFRKAVTAIFQNYIHYPYSINDNIAVDKLQHDVNDLAQVKVAAHKSMANEFIEKQTNQYDTQLCKEWESGVELSTGQWQRIAIARCLYRNVPICIFDEPFASLDAISTNAILNEINNNRSEKITLLITHQTKDLRIADEIILLDQGKVVAIGSHESLLQKSSMYRTLTTCSTETSFQTSKKE